MRLGPILLWPIFLGLALAPFALVRVPGLGDYLNHLARMHVLLAVGHSPALQRYYTVAWTPIPYLAMDAVVPVLASVLPLYTAGKVFVLACVALPVLGTACLHYVAHRRLSLVPLAATLFGANTLLAFGFLNYLFSLGCALLLFAGWVASADWPRWRRAAVFVLPVLVLYFGHAYACGGYCLAVCGFEAGRVLRRRPLVARDVALDCLAAFSQAVPALWFAATLNVQAGYVGALRTHYGSLGDKLVALISPILFLHDAVNGAVAVGAAALFGALLSRLRLHPALWPAMVPVALAAIGMPHVVASTWGMDLRLPLLLVLLLVAASTIGPSFAARAGVAAHTGMAAWLRGAGRAAAVLAVLALLAVKSADAWFGMRLADAAIAETRGILAGLPQGARLLVVNPAGRGTGRERIALNTIWHMPMTAVIDHDAFVPTLFTGLTTVRVKPGYLLSSTPNGLPVTPEQLRAAAAGNAPTAGGVAQAGSGQGDAGGPGDGEGARLYWLNWPHNFDYVLVQRYGAEVGEMPGNLALVARTANLELYRVR